MIDIKLTVTILTKGSDMVEESTKTIWVPKRTKSGKTIIKNGKPIMTPIEVESYDTHDHNEIVVMDENGKKDRIVFLTRKTKPCKRVINMSREAYEGFIDDEKPSKYSKTIEGKAWGNLTNLQRVEWHLKQIAASLQGELEDFKVFDD